MSLRVCTSCDDEFDPNSRAKKIAGGLIQFCPECSEETTVKYAGVQAADGKQSQATILKFQSEADKARYVSFFRNNSGINKGKSCQLGRHLSTDPGIHFETIVAHSPTNHKGRA